jgi:hypothetical protein
MVSRSAAAPHPSRLLTLVIGAVYTLVGLLGLVVTGVGDFAAETDKILLGYELHPLHNVVHLLIGLTGLALWRRLDTARTFGRLLLAGCCWLATGWCSSSMCWPSATPTLTSCR